MTALLAPTQLVAHLRAITDTWLRRRVLREARAACLAKLAYLHRRRLAAEEQGWADAWHLEHADLTTTLATIEQALATC